MKRLLALLLGLALSLPVAAVQVYFTAPSSNVMLPIVYVDTNGDVVDSGTSDCEIDEWDYGAAPDGFTDATNEATEIGTSNRNYLELETTETDTDFTWIKCISDTTDAMAVDILRISVVGADSNGVMPSNPQFWNDKDLSSNDPLPNVAPGANGGLVTGDANNRIAGIQGTKNDLDALNDISQATAEAAAETGADASLATYDGPTKTELDSGFAALENLSQAEANAAADTALSDYDGPTNTEMEARTLAAAAYFDPAADTVVNVTNVAQSSVDELQVSALADLFNTDSGTTYGSAVSGSVVAETADNAGGSALTEAGIADAVWDEAQSGHTTAGTFGELATEIALILADTAELQGDDIPGAIAALNDPTAAAVATAVAGISVESTGSIDLQDAISIILARQVGEIATADGGSGDVDWTITDPSGGATRITFTTNTTEGEQGSRDAVSLTPGP